MLKSTQRNTATKKFRNTMSVLVTAALMTGLVLSFNACGEQSPLGPTAQDGTGKQQENRMYSPTPISDKDLESCGCETSLDTTLQNDKLASLLRDPEFINALPSPEYHESNANFKIGKREEPLDPVFCYYYPNTPWGPVWRCFYERVYCDTFVWFDVTFCYPYPNGI